MLQFFAIFKVLSGKESGKYPLYGNLGQNSIQILAVDVMEIIMNNVFNRLGKPFKNIQILSLGEAFDLQRVG